MKTNHLIIAILSILVFTSCSDNLEDGLYAKFETAKGSFICSLDAEKAPLSVMSFVGLAEGSIDTPYGKEHYYDDTSFFTVVADVVVQGGDPEGTGSGYPGYFLPDEITDEMNLSEAGMLSMWSQGVANSGMSQFFINMTDMSPLNGVFTTFGKVVSGMETLEKLVEGDTLKKVTIIRKGKEAKAYQVTEDSFHSQRESAIAVYEESVRKAYEESKEIIKVKFADAKTSPDGYQYLVTKTGTGEKPKADQTVQVHYTGSLVDGTVFDSSIGADPLEFPVNTEEMISGFLAAVKDMRVGEKRTVILPPELAYGDQGNTSIPPKSFLVFELELVSAK